MFLDEGHIYINCNNFEFLINKVLDVKPLVSFIIKDYANSLTNKILNFKMFHFRDYVKTENLDGENKYDAGAHGLQVKLIATYFI